MSRLNNHVAVITGASRGQGEATARAFVAEGARVVIADVLETEGRTLAAELGDAAFFQLLDVREETQWQALVDETLSHWGQINSLVNNAGIVHPAAIADLKKEDVQRVFDINLIGPLLGIQALTPIMIKQGKGAIVNICSTSGLWGMNGLGAYSSSKWALRGLTKTAAMEYGHQGIRVNAVFPGGINTVMGNITDEPTEDLAKYYMGQPIQRIGEPEEVANTSLFLVSDDASYICGAEIAVDGGMTLGVYNSFLPGAPEV